MPLLPSIFTQLTLQATESSALSKLAPIVMLLLAIGLVVWRLPKVDVGHSQAFKRRRLLNWLPLGITYAMLYMGRYNFSAIASALDKQGILAKSDFNFIDAVGAAVYGVSFLLNGPLTDKWGGRVTIVLAAGGSAIVNLAMAWVFRETTPGQALDARTMLAVLGGLNMYFQSFGAVSIVKVNAPWFHVRERGLLGGVFGILISLGLYFAYDWSRAIAGWHGFGAAFWVPAVLLAILAGVAALLIRDTPGQAGFKDFETDDATAEGDDKLTVAMAFKKMLTSRVLLIIVGIEFCSGFLRNAVMKQYPFYAEAMGEKGGFVMANWGMLLCVAGILGGMAAGLVSDYVFGSRRGPVASCLYGGILVGGFAALGLLGTSGVGWAVVFMSLCVIGVHGMLSGTASMDFGGRKNTGVATGLIDGFVYLGTATQALVYGLVLPKGEAASSAQNWSVWPMSMLPVAGIGFWLALKVWNARPKSGAATH